MNVDRKIKIALIQPQYKYNKYYFDFTVYKLYENLGLEYLQASLEEAGYLAKNFEGPSLELSNKQIIESVIKFKPELVGITVDSHSLSNSIIIARAIKKELRNVHIVIGGHLSTCAFKEILNDYECIDSIILGYGEKQIVRIAEKLRNGFPIDKVTGIAFRKGNQIIHNPLRNYSLDIDNIPFPTRSTLKYRDSQGYPSSARMITSRGCLFNCNICTTPPFLASQKCDKWMGRSPKNVLDEITYLVNAFNTRIIIFCDDNFIGPEEYGKKRAEEIAHLIIKNGLNIHFWIMSRVDSFLEGGDEFVELLKKAGLWGIFLGVESGAESQLRAYGKLTSIAQNESIIGFFKRHNIMIELGFIMFHPYVTFEELKTNAEFLHRVGESCIFRYFVNRLETYPKIGFIEDLRQRNLLAEDYRYDSIHGYNFLEPRVGNFALALEEISDGIKSIDEIVWNFKRLSQLIGLLIRECQRIPMMHELAKELFRIKNSIDRIEINIGEINYQEFLKYMRIAIYEKRNLFRYNSVRARHKDRLSKEIKRITRDIKKLVKLENRLEKLRDNDLLKWFFKSPVYFKLLKYE